MCPQKFFPEIPYPSWYTGTLYSRSPASGKIGNDAVHESPMSPISPS